MKICHVNLASGYSGGENQTLLLIEHQLSLGYQLGVVAHPASPFYTRCTALDLELFACDQFVKQHPRSIARRYQLIHTHEGKAIYWALIHHLVYGMPYLITRRVDNPLKDKAMLKLAYKRAGVVVALSRAIKASIQQTIPSITPDIIPSSPVQYPDQETASLPERVIADKAHAKKIVLQVGKLYEHKGFDVTISAAKQLEQSHPNIAFYLLGDGPEEQRLKQQASGLSNLHLVGKQDNMGAWFAAADLIVHPSYSEGLGSVLLEASAAGLPLVGSQAGGIPDIIQDQVNGLLCQPGNAEDLARCITQICDHDDVSDRLKRNATRILDRFSIERSAQHYEAVYMSLLATP